MNPSLALTVVDPLDPDAVGSVEAYFAELDERFSGGFEQTGAIEADAERLRPPVGAFVLARMGDRVVGCGGVQTFEQGVGEIKRMWVDSEFRGRGVGAALLTELERISAELGHRVVRLDTNSQLPEAVAMYRRHGYTEIDRYNDNPYPDHFFEKQL